MLLACGPNGPRVVVPPARARTAVGPVCSVRKRCPVHARAGACAGGGVLTPAPRAPPQAAADSMTPVAGYYIREHVLRQPEETREDQAVHDWEAPWVSDYY